MTRSCAVELAVRGGYASTFFGVQQSLGLRGLDNLVTLRGAFLFERLARLLGHSLPRRFIRHRGPLISGACFGPGSQIVRPSTGIVNRPGEFGDADLSTQPAAGLRR